MFYSFLYKKYFNKILMEDEFYLISYINIDQNIIINIIENLRSQKKI